MSLKCFAGSGRSRGFSLVELVMIIVVLSLGVAGLTTLYGQLGGSISVGSNIGVGSEVAQRCAEHVLAQRRVNVAVGFVGISGDLCAGLPAFGGFTASSATAAFGGAGCPVGATCTQVIVTSTDGATTRALDFIVVDY